MPVPKRNCAFLPASPTRPLVDVRGCRKHMPRRQRDEVGDRSKERSRRRTHDRLLRDRCGWQGRKMKGVLALITISTLSFLFGSPPALALDPSLDISQYAHNAWTIREGFFKGNIYSIAQTPDGYLWLGTEFGLFRFDGVRSIPWQPPAGQRLPDKNINSLLVTRDGTLWIGTFAGLSTWNGTTLTPRTEASTYFVASLFEDSEGTVWVGGLGTPHGQLCAIRNSGTQCFGEDGAFSRAVWASYEDSTGSLWAAAQSGLWRMTPGPPRRYATSTELIGLST